MIGRVKRKINKPKDNINLIELTKSDNEKDLETLYDYILSNIQYYLIFNIGMYYHMKNG